MIIRVIMGGVIILAAGYSAVWAAGSWWVHDRVRIMAPVYAARGIVVDPSTVRITGFPLAFTVSFSLDLARPKDDPPLEGKIPIITLSSTLWAAVIHGDYHLSLPQGGALTRPVVLDVASAQARMAIPRGLPLALDRETILAWQEQGGRLHVRDGAVHVRDPSVSIGLEADMHIDPALQPDITLDVRIDNLSAAMPLIGTLIPDAQARTAVTGILGALTAHGTDQPTSHPDLDLRLRIVDRRLFIGPLQAGFVPPVVWADPPPGPGQ